MTTKVRILVTRFSTNCNPMATSSTSHVAFLSPLVFRNIIALNTWQEVVAIIATCSNHINTIICTYAHGNATTFLHWIISTFFTHRLLMDCFVKVLIHPSSDTSVHMHVLYRHCHTDWRKTYLLQRKQLTSFTICGLFHILCWKIKYDDDNDDCWRCVLSLSLC